MREAWVPRTSPARRRVGRVAVVSMHTCPLDQPGTGDSGGMNVYVRAVAKRLAETGVRVDVFTRAAGPEQHVVELDPGVRVVHLEAGPDAPVDKEELMKYLCAFLCSLLRFEVEEGLRTGDTACAYDVIHTHYWLSGWVGRLARERWGIPHVHSFHTLGRVKNRSLAAGEDPEPASRIAGEERIVHTADCILSPTAGEAADLVSLYGARPDRVRVVSPGVDTDRFRPGDPDAAKRAIGLPGRPLVLFVGRLQPLKQPDLAVRAIADLKVRRPELAGGVALLLLGGPSGRGGTSASSIGALSSELGIGDAVEVRAPVPHGLLPDYYRAADVVIVPSRTESFGLVALEAEACGTPVVATDIGGLRTTVLDGVTGTLVNGDGPSAFSRAIEDLLADPAARAKMGAAGARYARRFDWRGAAAGLLAVYEDLVPEDAAEVSG